jgi:tRNA-2-methylthio-N6-dimethylallyladenosine synthase
MCTFCVVPFTRGRERSRNPETILTEAKDLDARGYKEITLLGQNVDSYLWYGGGLKKDFEKASEIAQAAAVDFAKLLAKVAEAVPQMRIRFSTSNPQDMADSVLHTIAKYPNICNYIHLPVQSGSSRILKAMNRGHNREEYLALIERIRKIIPECGISHDMIAGFPTETEEDHAETLSLMDVVNYDYGYLYYYSERPNTFAERKMEDDVPLEVKKRRLNNIIVKQRSHSLVRNKLHVGKQQEILIEGDSKKSDQDWKGRNDQNAMVVFAKTGNEKKGDFVKVLIKDCNTATLFGEIVSKN